MPESRLRQQPHKTCTCMLPPAGYSFHMHNKYANCALQCMICSTYSGRVVCNTVCTITTICQAAVTTLCCNTAHKHCTHNHIMCCCADTCPASLAGCSGQQLSVLQVLCRNKSDASTVGGLAIAVSLELKGLEVAHTRHGLLPWAQLVQV